MSVRNIEVVPIERFQESIDERIHELEIVESSIYTALFTLRSVENWAIRLNVKTDGRVKQQPNARIQFWEVSENMRPFPKLITASIVEGMIECDYKPEPFYTTFIQPGRKTLDWGAGYLLPFSNPINCDDWPVRQELGNDLG
jgi:hypothetical protein